MPQVGMTVDQLVDCGCVLANSGNLSSLSTERSGVQRVIIVNYFCPLGAQGIARASVVNGVVDAVYR